MKGSTENDYFKEIQSKRIRECMEECGINGKELAKKLNYTPQHISYVLNGKRNLTKELAIKLAEIFSSSKTKTVFVNIPYSELTLEQKENISICDIDKNGNVSLPFDFCIKINYSYLLGESDIKNEEEVFDPPPEKDDDYMFQKGIQHILKRNGYALCFDGFEGITPNIMENSVFHKNSAINSILCSNIAKQNPRIKMVKVDTGETYHLSPLDLFELLNDYEQMLLSITDRYFKKLKIKQALTIPPKDTPPEDIPL